LTVENQILEIGRHAEFRTPTSLSVSENNIEKILIVGSCISILTRGVFETIFNIKCQEIHINAIDDFDFATIDSDFDFQLTSIPMDSVLPRHSYHFDDLNDEERATQRFRSSCDNIRRLLESSLTLNKKLGLLTFVCNFMVPAQNPQGRLLPRYTFRNSVYFIEQLNEFLASEIEARSNCYVIDVDAITASLGKSLVQDDSIWGIAHGGVFTELDFEIAQTLAQRGHTRIEQVPPVKSALQAIPSSFWLAICNETLSAYRTVKNIDQVKVVAIDLDDTLWRGIAAENPMDDPMEMIEGVPLGIVEALLFLKSRGIAIAIVSKNDYEKVKPFWDATMRWFIRLEEFVAIKINWNSKADNIRELAHELNVGLDSIVFIDDNPREREEVKLCLPQVRVIGSDYYDVRRTLLWSSETQVATITAESARKTEMLKSNIEREQLRQTMSRDEFLSSLELKISCQKVIDANNSSMSRLVELINKTNQFNTTGVRWSFEEVTAIFDSGGMGITFNAQDRLTNYGIISAALIKGNHIEIFVMSCRVIGLDVEIAALSTIEELVRQKGFSTLTAVFAPTDRNILAASLYERAGFSHVDGVWSKDISIRSPLPTHISYL